MKTGTIKEMVVPQILQKCSTWRLWVGKSQFKVTVGCPNAARAVDAVTKQPCGGAVFPPQMSWKNLQNKSPLSYCWKYTKQKDRVIYLYIHWDREERSKCLKCVDIIGCKYFDFSLFISLTFHKKHSNIDRLGSSINTCATKLGCVFTVWKWLLQSAVGIPLRLTV